MMRVGSLLLVVFLAGCTAEPETSDGHPVVPGAHHVEVVWDWSVAPAEGERDVTGAVWFDTTLIKGDSKKLSGTGNETWNLSYDRSPFKVTLAEGNVLLEQIVQPENCPRSTARVTFTVEPGEPVQMDVGCVWA